MLIGEAATLTGFSKDTIRWYEKIGLINLDRNSRSENNYRSYDKKTIDKLLLIRQIKNFGFTLKEIGEFLFLLEIGQIKCVTTAEVFENKLEIIDKKITELQNIKTKLVLARSKCTGDCLEVLNEQYS